MKIENYRLKDITPYENNPRNNDDAVEKVAESIREFGWQQPIVIDKNNVIICGHTKYRAAELLGADTVPCVVADNLTDEQAKAYRLADNKTNEFAGWDFEMLEAELDDIKLDMEPFGFDVGGG